MATILLIGSDGALLEGLAQSIAGAGHGPHLAGTVDEASELAAQTPPLVIVSDRDVAASEPMLLRLPVEPGGALILYRSSGRLPTPLSPALQRSALADLELPLERHRLLALIQRVDERARLRGRGGQDETPEHHVR